MYPELFSIGNFTVHGYGFMIMLGAIGGYIYMSHVAQKELNVAPEKIQNLAILIIIAAFVGGKLLFYLEKPSYYFGDPTNMIKGLRQGFVFYGSLLFAIPTAAWYFKKEKWPVWPFMDRLAVTGTIIHGFGRLGCFMAGCCYGQSTDVPWGITFNHPHSQADPLHTPLHPTQLYESFFIFILFIFLFQMSRHKKFEGQIFCIYIAMYAIGRAVIEVFRGDLQRGFIFKDWVSHSQFISILLIAGIVFLYQYLSKRPDLKVKRLNK